jgi:hypothetical protein
MELSNIKIRNYQIDDRKAIRKISLESIFLGEYRHSIFDDEILADFLTMYFTDYEPSSCFVAIQENQVIGYVMGSQEVSRMHRIIKYKIAPHLAYKVLLSGHLLHRNNLIFIQHIISSYLNGEFITPDFSQEYPATLHINITTEYRRQHIGSVMVEYFLDFLKNKRVKGIHFGVLSVEAKKFFLKLNFNLLYSEKYSFLRYLCGENIPHYIMGKHI